ncbi:MAG: hypothetical protein U0528_06760 [Anaerolineae bacterium]
MRFLCRGDDTVDQRFLINANGGTPVDPAGLGASSILRGDALLLGADLVEADLGSVALS